MKLKNLIEIAIAGQKDGYPKDPLPNFVFTRDNILTLHNSIFLPTMTKKARKRENFLVKFVLSNSPLFNKFFAGDFTPNQNDTFEGGDFLLIDEETIFIGISDRTTIGFVRKFADYLFKKNNAIKTIVGIRVELKHERSMHLDTYMGVIGDYIIVFDEPLVTSNDNTFYVFKRESNNSPELFLGNFDMLLQKINKNENFEVIHVSEKREAYDDACNVLSINKNQIITYDRGAKTVKKLGERGFTKIIYCFDDKNKGIWKKFILENDEWQLQDQFDKLIDFYKKDGQYVFEIEGSELILARGGCHCMSMPLERIH